jgi:hypothetical protein
LLNRKNKIKILLYGEKYHAKAFCEQLENYEKGIFEPKYSEKALDYKLTDFDLFHLISPPLPAVMRFAKYNKPVLYHWIGTDVYRFLNDLHFKKVFKRFLLRTSKVTNLVVSDNLKEELNSLNVNSAVLPLVKLKFVNEVPRFPEKFSVLSYIPEKRWDFYKGDLILQIARNMPDTDFHIFSLEAKTSVLPNVFFYDFIEDVSPFYKKSSALVRLTIHDGLPKMVLEALSYGRHVLWNESFPYCHKVSDVKDCINILNKLKSDSVPNEKGKKFVEQNFNPEKILNDYLALCIKLLGEK